MTREDIEDLICIAIDDSIDMDWTSKDAVRSIMRALEAEGLKITSIERELRDLAEQEGADYVHFAFFCGPQSAYEPFFSCNIHCNGSVRSEFGQTPDQAAAKAKAKAKDPRNAGKTPETEIGA